MKHILSAIFLAIAIGCDRGLSISDPGPEMKRSSNTCGDPTDALPFYRIYNPTETNYLYTIGTGVVGTVGTTFQGVAALVFATQEESTVPFYHLTNDPIRDNFYTISTKERDSALKNGYINQPDATYIYPTQLCGSVPFYRLYQQTTQTNFYTASESERLDYIANHAFTDIEIAGYVLPLASQCS
ncbi:hypothetical protein B0H13DRAFT_2376181 [Mycena leptocephala]|nr:hypothetical protein B0H13DRAFT_2376181 [Mycena leptocephala]